MSEFAVSFDGKRDKVGVWVAASFFLFSSLSCVVCGRSCVGGRCCIGHWVDDTDVNVVGCGVVVGDDIELDEVVNDLVATWQIRIHLNEVVVEDHDCAELSVLAEVDFFVEVVGSSDGWPRVVVAAFILQELQHIFALLSRFDLQEENGCYVGGLGRVDLDVEDRLHVSVNDAVAEH